MADDGVERSQSVCRARTRAMRAMTLAVFVALTYKEFRFDLVYEGHGCVRGDARHDNAPETHASLDDGVRCPAPVQIEVVLPIILKLREHFGCSLCVRGSRWPRPITLFVRRRLRKAPDGPVFPYPSEQEFRHFLCARRPVPAPVE